jgi:hypothetical protein
VIPLSEFRGLRLFSLFSFIFIVVDKHGSLMGHPSCFCVYPVVTGIIRLLNSSEIVIEIETGTGLGITGLTLFVFSQLLCTIAYRAVSLGRLQTMERM